MYKAPKLQGQHGWYLEQSLKNFRYGTRGTGKGDKKGMSMRL